MQLGMIGLGRMGNGMTERLREGGHEVCTYDPKVEERTAASLEELKGQLEAPRAFWMMIPAGKITEDVFHDLLGLAGEGDTIVDGGNSNFHDSKRRYAEAQEKGIDEAHRLFDDLAAAGIDYDDVVRVLEEEGVQKFIDSFTELLDGVQSKKHELVGA